MKRRNLMIAVIFNVVVTIAGAAVLTPSTASAKNSTLCLQDSACVAGEFCEAYWTSICCPTTPGDHCF